MRAPNADLAIVTTPFHEDEEKKKSEIYKGSWALLEGSFFSGHPFEIVPSDSKGGLVQDASPIRRSSFARVLACPCFFFFFFFWSGFCTFKALHFSKDSAT